MKEIVQIYTDIFRGSFILSRKLIFIAEGYRSIDEPQFYKDVYAILDRLENTFPFSVLKGNGNVNMFSSCVSFTASAQSGHATSQAQAVFYK